VAAEANINPFPADDPINYSYRVFVEFFKGISRPLTADDVTLGAFFTYGWMPTMLDNFSVANLPQVTAILNRAKGGAFPSNAELVLLKASINNSLVGTSKLLHFLNPSICAIWDRRVYRYIGPAAKYPPVENIQNYLDYHQNLLSLIADPAFAGIQSSMEQKVGYAISPFRAAEYVMFMNA
jgi:hypothetical protein